MIGLGLGCCSSVVEHLPNVSPWAGSPALLKKKKKKGPFYMMLTLCTDCHKRFVKLMPECAQATPEIWSQVHK
jgi:hypothetical protein